MPFKNSDNIDSLIQDLQNTKPVYRISQLMIDQEGNLLPESTMESGSYYRDLNAALQDLQQRIDKADPEDIIYTNPEELKPQVEEHVKNMENMNNVKIMAYKNITLNDTLGTMYILFSLGYLQ